jgi:hypothetical protein
MAREVTVYKTLKQGVEPQNIGECIYQFQPVYIVDTLFEL